MNESINESIDQWMNQSMNQQSISRTAHPPLKIHNVNDNKQNKKAHDIM